MISGIRKLVSGSGLGARLARGGSAALIIRMASVATSYLMFVVLARHMSADEYGKFAWVFSLATLVAVVAVLGQPMLVLRMIPSYQHDENEPLLKGLVRDSRWLVILGSILLAILMAVVAIGWGRINGVDASYIMWGGLLMVAMAVARHQAYMMRAFGNIVIAMGPRDVLWRVAVIVVTMIVARDQVSLSASYAINICSVTLIVIWLAQMFGHPSVRPAALFETGLETDRPLWAKESLGLWSVSILQAVGPNLSVVIVGLMMLPSETALFFAALKTATLLRLPLAAGGVVAAPMISRHYRAGEISDVQKISNYMVVGISVPVLLGLLFLVLFGDWILGFFGPDFTAAHKILVITALGTLGASLSGPTGIIMNMTGHHKEYLGIMAVTQALFLALLPVAIHYYGMTGAAVAYVFGMVSWNLWVWRWSRRHLSVDPTIYGVFEWLLRGRKDNRANDEKT